MEAVAEAEKAELEAVKWGMTAATKALGLKGGVKKKGVKVKQGTARMEAAATFSQDVHKRKRQKKVMKMVKRGVKVGRLMKK